MEEGQLTGSWRFLVLKEDSGVPPLILGTFVRTPRDRVLFFPGGKSVLITDDPTVKFYARHLDHITLDPHRTATAAFHVASRGFPPEQSRGLEYRTTPPPGQMVYWFSLLLPSLEGLSVFPNALSITFPPPRGNIDEFCARLMDDGGYSEMDLLAPPEGAASFLQFDIWVGRGIGWRDLGSHPLPWALFDEIVEDAGPQRLQGTRTAIPFADDLGVVVFACRPIGTLSTARLLRARLNR
jgi:hypothetical protein